MNRDQRRHPMQNGHNMTPSGIPLIGPKAKEQSYTCRASHTYESVDPWRVHLPAGPGQFIRSDPVCPFCLYNFLSFSFPCWPADLTIEQAVEQGLLKPEVLRTTEAVETTDATEAD